MKLRTTLLLSLILFAFTTTLAMGLSTSKPNLQESFKETILDSDPLPPPPGPNSGDPIGGGGGPH